MRSDLDFWEKSYSSNFEGSIGYNDRPSRKRKLSVRNEKILQRLATDVKPKITLEPSPVDPNIANLEIIRNLAKQNSGQKGTQVSIDSGFVYAIQNPAWPGWIKIGQTIDFETRLKTYQTSSPLSDYHILFTWMVDDRRLVERELLDSLRKTYKVSGEWVEISKEDFLDFIRK